MAVVIEPNVRAARRIAWSVFGFALALAAIGLVLSGVNGAVGDLTSNLAFSVIFISMGFTGVLIASRQPRNTIAWLLIGAVTVLAISFVADEYTKLALVRHPGLPAGRWALWLTFWLGALGYIPLVTYLFLLFPNGRLLSRRWRPVAWGIGAGLLITTLGG